jgi:hypothetical protein
MLRQTELPIHGRLGGLELDNILPLAIYLDGLKGCMLWSNGTYLEHVRQAIGHLKRVLRIEEPLTDEESYQLLQLSEAIANYGRMIQAYEERSVPYVIVEIPELARRFRETSRTIKDALLLLKDMGRAEPVHMKGCWKLKLAGSFLHGHEAVHSVRHHSETPDDDKGDAGAA